MKKKKIAILGSTGSIGVQALEVLSEFPDLFEVEVLTANNNSSLLLEQAKKHKPNSVVIVNEKKYIMAFSFSCQSKYTFIQAKIMCSLLTD